MQSIIVYPDTMWARLCIVILSVNLCQSSKILVFPVSGKSHVFSMTVIAEELIRRGHSVTMLLQDYFPAGKDLESNRTGINLERIMPVEGEVTTDYELWLENVTLLMLEGKTDIFKLSHQMGHIFVSECNRMLMHNEKLFEKLKGMNFDLVVVEGFFASKCLYLVPHRLGIPFVTYADILNPVTSGVPLLPSFVPHQMSAFSEKMTFGERLQNTVMVLLFTYVNLIPVPSDEILNRYRQYGDFDNLDELSSRSLLWLVTRDSVLDYPKPSMPNVINIGGLTAKTAKGKLTPELEKFMSHAKKGVILVTFGSQVVHLPISMANKFISAFRSFPDYQIIWRFKNRDNLPISDNVMLAQWLPQNDLLADSRVKLFITHSGNNGQYEAIYHGVPMIGFPVGGDQPYNAGRLPARGYGIAMDIQKFTAEQLVSNIFEMLNNPTYRQRTTLASKIFKSARETPTERACYWIEDVIEFGGEHLRSAGLELNIFQYYMLDMMAFVLVLLAVIVVAILKLVLYLVRCCRKRKDGTKKKTD